MRGVSFTEIHSETILMIILILYALAILAFACWILGWCLWHGYLAFSRFLKTHNHKRRT